MHKINQYNFQENYKLESGVSIAGLYLNYETFGTLNEAKDNVIWIVHALTANANPFEWWPGVVGTASVINPNDYFIICVNNPGSPYGSTNPLSFNVESGIPYYDQFPLFTTRDIGRIYNQLRLHLGLSSIKLLIGASLGGQIASEFAIEAGSAIENLILISTNAKHSAWGIAFNESQRMAIKADNSWGYKNENAASNGLKAARAMALLSYRTYEGYNATQTDVDNRLDNYKASSYQKYQGEKLIQRFNAYAYHTITQTMDSHDVSRHRGSIKEALTKIKAHTTVIGINSDILFPITEQQTLAQHIPNAKFVEIGSQLGHDGFLTEAVQVSDVIGGVLTNKVEKKLVKVV